MATKRRRKTSNKFRRSGNSVRRILLAPSLAGISGGSSKGGRSLPVITNTGSELGKAGAAGNLIPVAADRGLAQTQAPTPQQNFQTNTQTQQPSQFQQTAPSPQAGGDVRNSSAYNFQLLVNNMLKSNQGVDSSGLAEKRNAQNTILAEQRALQRAQFGRTSEITPDVLQNLSPAAQDAIRSGKSAAFDPTIDANAMRLKILQDEIDDITSAQAREQELAGEDNERLSRADAESLGVPFGTRRSEAFGLMSGGGSGSSGKPLNQFESKSRGFAQRMLQANSVIDDIGSEFTDPKTGFPLPNVLKSENRQLYEQAKRNFVNAVLRLESGAAISPEEFRNAESQYFPQGGDHESVVAQKKQNRDTVIQTMSEAGRLGELGGAGGGGFGGGGDTGPPSDGEIIEVNGQKYRDDGSGNFTLASSFNQNSSSSLGEFKNRIAGVESGGRYDALGPVQKNGHQAVGKYQVMTFNIPQWSREALGQEVSPQQFRSSPQIQEKIVSHQMNKIFEKYGNWPDVASVWHSGVPLAKAQKRRDSLGTGTPDYVNRVFA